MNEIHVSSIAFTPARSHLQRRGLLGWCSLVLNRLLRLESVAIRASRDHRRVLAHPTRPKREGGERTPICPTSSEAQRAIETAVFTELNRHGVLP
jgi:hypothetical protein